jgi:hypothetical protein
MRYQLVLQFSAEGPQDFETLVDLEKLIAKRLPADSNLDGHDFGSGEFNIFVLTDRPEESFRSVQNAIQLYDRFRAFKAAYRHVGQEDFVLLWPPESDQFTVA